MIYRMMYHTSSWHVWNILHKKHHNLCNIFLKIFLIFFWKCFSYFFENVFHIFWKCFSYFFWKFFWKYFSWFFWNFFIKNNLEYIYIIGSGGVFFQSGFNVKTHVQVHFTIASQFYVRVDVEIFLHVFMHLYGGEKQVC